MHKCCTYMYDTCSQAPVTRFCRLPQPPRLVGDFRLSSRNGPCIILFASTMYRHTEVFVKYTNVHGDKFYCTRLQKSRCAKCTPFSDMATKPLHNHSTRPIKYNQTSCQADPCVLVMYMFEIYNLPHILLKAIDFIIIGKIIQIKIQLCTQFVYVIIHISLT